MQPTIFGFIVVLVGLVSLFRPIHWAFALAVVCTEFGGAAAINVPALGGSSIQPSHLALGFLVLRLLLERRVGVGGWVTAIEDNLFLFAFGLYTAITAFILPRLFQGEISVIPLRVTNGNFFTRVPVGFSSQNITAAVYLIGTALFAISAALMARRRETTMKLISALIWVGWLHVAFGVADLVLSAAGHHELLDFFRNGNYAQLNQGEQGFHRIAGVFAETSAYSHYALVFLVFTTELWLRSILVTQARALALALLTMLLLTTSTSAYIGVAAYSLVLAARFIFVPGGVRPGFVVSSAGVVLCAAGLALLLVVADPHLSDRIIQVVTDMTVNKATSASGRERAAWAAQALQAFSASHGLGVGAGSFRSSSLVYAILGSSGLVGAAFFFLALANLIKPFRASTYRADVDGRQGAGVAAAWAAAIGLAPLVFTGTSADPGALFGLFAGLAMGWRGVAALRRAQPTRWTSARGPGLEGAT